MIKKFSPVQNKKSKNLERKETNYNKTWPNIWSSKSEYANKFTVLMLTNKVEFLGYVRQKHCVALGKYMKTVLKKPGSRNLFLLWQLHLLLLFKKAWDKFIIAISFMFQFSPFWIQLELCHFFLHFFPIFFAAHISGTYIQVNITSLWSNHHWKNLLEKQKICVYNSLIWKYHLNNLTVSLQFNSLSL